MPALGKSLGIPFAYGRGNIGGLGANDPDAYDWVGRVIAAGGTVSVPTAGAASTFVTNAKAHGYWTKLNRVNLFAGDQLIACLIPLKVGGGSAAEQNVGPFVAGDYTESTGLTGNGTTKYLRTNLNPGAVLTLNNTHLAIYSRRGSADAGIHGSQVAAAQTLNLGAPNGSGNLASEAYNGTVGQGHLEAAVTAPYGLMIGSRTASNSHTIYQAGISKGTSAGSGGTLPGGDVWIFALSNSGTPFGINSGPLAGYSIGDGLTAGNVTDYTADMQTFQTSLGRQV